MPGWLERNQLVVLCLAVIVFIASIAVIQLTDETPPAIEFTYGSGLPDGTPIRVHVTGAVLQPGVYELREGDRLIEALSAAGGPASDADTEALNLARRVRDEEQVVVPRRGSAGAPRAVATLAPGARLDINTATEAQLDQLPGIGEAYSRRIVDSRRVDGPFKTAAELVERRVVPQATFEMIRDLISVSP
jgi:competence protein ComEA